jgi:hypothetical protein
MGGVVSVDETAPDGLRVEYLLHKPMWHHVFHSAHDFPTDHQLAISYVS